MKLFENLPSTKTPINAENLNQIQDNLVIVSKTEPTGDNREKVWIQKGKNHFNKNSLKITNAWQVSYTLDDNKKIEMKVTAIGGVAFVRTNITELKAGTYTFSATTQGHLNEIRVYKSSGSSLKTSTSNTFTFTLTENTSIYFEFYVYNTTLTNLLSVENIQIEQGSIATPYEAYIEPKIYVKNNNDVYEEFINVNDIPSEVKRYDITMNCGLVLHFFKYGKVVNCFAEGTISSLNKDTDQSCDIPKEFAPVYAFRHVVVMNETGILGYININTEGYFLFRTKTTISSAVYPRFSFTYIAVE